MSSCSRHQLDSTEPEMLCHTLKKVDGTAASGLDAKELRASVAPKAEHGTPNAKGMAVGGGHVLHVLCDLSIASSTARFGQAGPRVGSFDAGYGSAYLARVVGEKRARQIWFLLDLYDAQTAERWGLVNDVVEPDQLLDKAREYARKIASYSPTALRFLKHSFNADSDHLTGIGNVAFAGLDLFVHSDEGMEGARAFAEKRKPDFSPYR